jgi:hypothetical protein
MVTTNQEIQTLHFEHKLWLNELKFFADELIIYNHRLEDLVDKSNDKEMLASLEHFQNQFIRQKEVLDTLTHDINIHEKSLKAVFEGKIEADTDYHEYLRDQVDTFKKIYNELKAEFYRFMAKWM